MIESTEKRNDFGHGGHFITAVTGSSNSEYLIRWTELTARKMNATWSALHVKGQEEEPGDDKGLEKNLALARELGAEVVSLLDREVPTSIVRYARIKGATALVIGKGEETTLPFLGKRNIMEEILRESDDLDVIILRGKTPMLARRRQLKLRPNRGAASGILVALLGLSAVTALGIAAQPVLGYRSVSILYLLTIITLPFAASRLVVFFSAVLSALLWNFLFIPPKLTFSIASLEDILMFAAFFLAAFVGGFLTSRLKEKESALSQRERRMTLLYGFTRGISRIRNIEEIVKFAEDFLKNHLRLSSAVLLRKSGKDLDTHTVFGGTRESIETLGLGEDLARRCFSSNESVLDGDDRMYLPLGSQSSVIGVLFVTGRGERSIRGESRELLAALAGNMALSLEREILSAENEKNKMASETARLSKILLNHISHELRTPLTTIKGSVSGLLEGNTAEDPNLREALLFETMVAANKLNLLVEDLLVMSRLESGKLSPHPEVTFINDLLGAAQGSLNIDLAQRTVVLADSARDQEIEADPVLMVQVFRNILRNFAAYTDPGSKLMVSSKQERGFSIITFSDNGPGVSEEDLPLLFDTFYRGTKGLNKQGCGLGLSICRGIVEVHGGTIEADRDPSGGLLITLHLLKKGAL